MKAAGFKCAFMQLRLKCLILFDFYIFIDIESNFNPEADTNVRLLRTLCTAQMIKNKKSEY